MDFIGDHCGGYGVESICTVLPNAPATYRVHRPRRENPELRPARAKHNDGLCLELERMESGAFARVYGAYKIRRDSPRTRRILKARTFGEQTTTCRSCADPLRLRAGGPADLV